MGRKQEDEKATIRSRIQDMAQEQSEFCLQDLAAVAVQNNVFDERKLDRFQAYGTQKYVKAILKEVTDSGAPYCVAIERGPRARWKVWSHCTRIESRRALQILAQQLSRGDRRLKAFKAAHEERFKEEVTLPKVTRPQGWNEHLEMPPTTR